jgi:hypothetical protein
MKRLILAMIVASVLVGCGNEAHEQEADIWTAAATGDIGAVERHVAAGTDIDTKDPAGGASPLIVAALYGQTEAARVLVRNGASVNSTNSDGATALHVAAFFCHPEMVAFLLEQGADVEARNRFGQTALETVAGEWNSDLEGIYNMVAGLWKLELNMERIRELRPQVAELIRSQTEDR